MPSSERRLFLIDSNKAEFESRTRARLSKVVSVGAFDKCLKLPSRLVWSHNSVDTVTCNSFHLALTFAAQDRFTVKSPNGIAFSEFKGYDAWQVIARSQTEDGVKAIVGNAAMIKAYNDGIPANGKAVPDGAAMAKIEWSKKSNAASPYAVAVPDRLKSLSFMVKDAKRFPDTDGWGYAQFAYDSAAGNFKPFGNGPAFAKTLCHQCHIRGAKASDFVFTSYAPR